MVTPLISPARTALCLLAGHVLVGCAKPPEPLPIPPPRVTVQHPLQRDELNYNEYSGWADASATVEVRSRVRGHIKEVLFKDGQFVNAGDKLFELDREPFEAEYLVATSKVGVAEAQLAFEIEEEKRQKELFAKNVVTQSELDRVIATRRSWEANVAAAKAEAERKKLDRDYATIAAPMPGKIGQAKLVAGNLVGAGGSDPLLTTIVSVNPIYVYFNVDERGVLEFRRLHPEIKGSSPEKPPEIPIEFGLETDVGYPRKGKIDFRENKIDASTGTIIVRGTADNADEVILPGSRVRVRVPLTNKPYPATLVPDLAVLSDQDQRYLLCLNDKSEVIRRNITLGRLMADGMRVILPGPADEEPVTADDWVIVDGLQRARINYPVEPRDKDGEAVAVTATADAAK
ncbi:MAG TPA: efflux RND transporter periplasmic adaptor subunit [Planctomycetaceae bacterium]|nr:efflux RND transporter periplasmic adaptor subunit [Planctomycetaceae bacterium]